MECSDVKKSSQNVRVAVNIRPLITPELLLGCTDCITVVPGEPQVQIRSKAYTFDYVYGNMGSPSTTIYDDCVAPLVEALFLGFNATVLAYGQMGSGKTYTMGTNYSGEGSNSGVIPKAMESIFKRIDSKKEGTEILTRVSFIEILNDEVFDLLVKDSSSSNKSEGAVLAKPVKPSRVPLKIKETGKGEIILDRVSEAEVRTKEEMASYLSRGSLSRATGSTNMNSQSSRSHAIFTITLEKKEIAHTGAGGGTLCAKFHLVDLAGSERAKQTGADGMRLKEGIHINQSLLALGNVISALGDGGHVPYRASKLTRLLQDSLGGNSKTVMIACVSPANTNVEETLSTLNYAERACKIQNKAVINRNPMEGMERMRSQIEQLQADNAELQRELQERRERCLELEGELLRVKNSHNLKRSRASDCVVVDEEEEPEHSSILKDFKKRLFVGGIPPSVSEDELKNVFSKHGKVLEHFIARDHETNRSRGFGFVSFDSKEVVDELLSKGKWIDMAGTRVEIKLAVPRNASNTKPPPPYGSNSRGRSFNDGFGGYGGSYGDFDGGFGPGPYRNPAGVGGACWYGSGGGGYGGFGGSSVGGDRGGGYGYASDGGEFRPRKRTRKEAFSTLHF